MAIAIKTIPKIIRHIWFGKDLKDPFDNPFYLKCATSNKQFLEGYEQTTWNKQQCYDFVKEHFPQYYDVYCKLSKDIMRIDIIRYMMLHVLGGIYMDHDITLNKGFDEHLGMSHFFVMEKIMTEELCIRVGLRNPIRNKVKEDQRRISNYCMGSIPGEQIWLDILKEIFNRIEVNPKCITLPKLLSQYDILYLTGPDAVSHVVNRSEGSIVLSLPDSKSLLTHHEAGTWRRD